MAPEKTQQKVRTIEKSITIRAQSDEIFHALTDAEELTQWFPESAYTDPEIGGKYEFIWHSFDVWHKKYGIFTDIIPGIMISYTWPVSNLNPYSIVTYYLHSQGDYTTIIFSHSGFEDGSEWDTEFEEHSEIWAFFLENLKFYLEEGIDTR